MYQISLFSARSESHASHILPSAAWKRVGAFIYSVEEVNKLVMQGLPFRKAYQEVARQIRDGAFKPDQDLKHVHIGSIGNPSNEKIAKKMEEILGKFDFEKINRAFEQLLKP